MLRPEADSIPREIQSSYQIFNEFFLGRENLQHERMVFLDDDLACWRLEDEFLTGCCLPSNGLSRQK
jgi:hypothetical protein